MTDQKLTDDELEEMIYLYRVVRADNATKEEIERARFLLARYEKEKKDNKR